MNTHSIKSFKYFLIPLYNILMSLKQLALKNTHFSWPFILLRRSEKRGPLVSYEWAGVADSSVELARPPGAQEGPPA